MLSNTRIFSCTKTLWSNIFRTSGQTDQLHNGEQFTSSGERSISLKTPRHICCTGGSGSVHPRKPGLHGMNSIRAPVKHQRQLGCSSFLFRHRILCIQNNGRSFERSRSGWGGDLLFCSVHRQSIWWRLQDRTLNDLTHQRPKSV